MMHLWGNYLDFKFGTALALQVFKVMSIPEGERWLFSTILDQGLLKAKGEVK